MSETDTVTEVAKDDALTESVRKDLVEIMSDRDAYTRAARLATVLPTLGPETVSAASEILMDPTLWFTRRGTEVELLLRYWATYEPAAAALWAVERAPEAYQVGCIYTAVSMWAEADPQAVVEALESWSKRRRIVDPAEQSLILGWYARGDSPELVRYIENLGISVSRQRAISTYIRARLLDEGIEAVMRWAESLPDDESKFKLAVYRQIAYRASIFDRDAALAWCELQCDGDHGSEMRKMIASPWLQQDPLAAMEWLLTAPESHERTVTSRSSYRRWLAIDKEGALAWMADKATDGQFPPEVQAILPVYAEIIGKDSPITGIELASQIENEDYRHSTLVQIAIAWHRFDPDGCEAWLPESPLREDARERVRNSPARGRPRKAADAGMLELQTLQTEP